MKLQSIFSLSLLLLLLGCTSPESASIASTTVSKWEKLELDFNGPSLSEQAASNPFADYRLDVTFTNGSTSITVPGFYAADGNAAETSADSGSVWRVRFRPELEGEWKYQADFRSGKNVAFSGAKGEYEKLDNSSGTIMVTTAAAGESGRLIRNHPRYLQWAESKDYFLKGGADSPENIMAYAGFDGTFRYEASDSYGEASAIKEFLHRFAIHEKDWKTGDADWQNGKGKGIIGALNYIAERGINSFYFLSMNINGDGKDVWPYTGYKERYRFDVSKLAQWEKVFDHADDELGMMLHFVLGETENETLLDNGDMGPERQIYYRELIARFGHHRAITWNLGEENGPNDWSENPLSTAQQKAIAAWLDDNDPYANYVSVHTHPNSKERRKYFGPLVGAPGLDGLSVQIDQPTDGHETTLHWLDTTASAGTPWIVTIDEIGPWWRGLDPDNRKDLNNQDSVRAHVLWGNLMAGGAGAEWYFGGKQPQNDLNTEDWTQYDNAWRWTGHALRFFQDHLPFQEMESMDEIVNGNAYCFAKPGEVYAVYIPEGKKFSIDLKDQRGAFRLFYYNPRTGGELTEYTTVNVSGGNLTFMDVPGEGDWVALITR